MSAVFKRAGSWWTAPTALFCGFVVWFPVTDSDIWWHCAAGREIVARGSFLFTDPFSYTAAGLPWYDLHWLFQVCMFGVCAAGGAAGLVLVKCLLFATACTIAFFSFSGRRKAFISTAVFCLFMYGIRYQVTERPALFTLVFMALFLFVLERGMAARKFRALALLVPIQVLWVNTQGLFGLGIALFGFYAAGGFIDDAIGFGQPDDGATSSQRAARRQTGLPAVVAAALVLACLVNPYGWKSLAFGLKLLGAIEPVPGNTYSTAIAENIPLTGLIGTPNVQYFWITILAALATVFSFVIRGRKTHSAHVLTATAFCVLAFMANRNVLLFVFVAAPITAHNLSAVFDRMAEDRSVGVKGFHISSKLTLAASGAMLLVLGAFMFSHALVLARAAGSSSLAPFRFPDKTVAYLKSHTIPGRLFNTDRFGGYLLWKLQPPVPVYIDGRFTLRGAGFLRDYCAMLDDPGRRFASVKDRYGITQASVQTALFPVYERLAAYLYRDPHWRLVVADGSEALFVADSLAPTARLDLGSVETVDSVAAGLKAMWAANPALYEESLFHFGMFLRTVGEQASADRIMEILRRQALDRS